MAKTLEEGLSEPQALIITPPEERPLRLMPAMCVDGTQ